MKNKILIICIAILSIFKPFMSIADGTITGKVKDIKTGQGIPFASVAILGTSLGTTTDMEGKFSIITKQEGYIRLSVSCVGYKPAVSSDIFVTKEKSPYIEISLESSSTNLTEVEIKAPQFVKKEESPVSLQTIGIREIERNPGGNRDISQVIRSLPGVASSPSFRNDIIIRGGSPAENKFFLDGIEIPVINHFQTQGSTGGPVGIINVDFLREVDFYSGAFPASRGNALSSVMDFKQIEGNREKHGVRFSIGSSETGITFDGPITPKTTYLFSARRSYLQFLFKAFKLPFLPTFSDMQFKLTHRFDDKNEITWLGLAAYDVFVLNESVNEGVEDVETKERNDYFLSAIPENSQWNYTTGVNYKHYANNGFTSVVLSTNKLFNESEKYFENRNEDPNLKTADYESGESETKFRVERTFFAGSYKILAGLGLEYASFDLNGFNSIQTPTGSTRIAYQSDIDFIKYAGFLSISRELFNSKARITGGVRTDATGYSQKTSNPLDQISPRVALSYQLTKKLSINTNAGIYNQLPSYTILGFADGFGNLLNKSQARYIRCDQIIGGLQYNPDESSKITLEAFSKYYSNYPLSIQKGISLANLGSDFGTVGNESVIPVSSGRAQGIELMAQRRSPSGIYGIVALTLVNSEFDSGNDKFVASSWDNNLFTTITAGKKWSRNWETGLKWRYVTGRPYTPYDVATSSLKSNWDATGFGILDYTNLNTLRVPDFHQLDIRVDKSWFFNKWSLNLYLDIENLYNFKSKEPDILFVRTDSNGKPVEDPLDPTRYKTFFIKDESGTVLPTIGVILDF
ncbi:MAG: TonB-dependent receptor [Bacteroidota bacterium]